MCLFLLNENPKLLWQPKWETLRYLSVGFLLRTVPGLTAAVVVSAAAAGAAVVGAAVVGAAVVGAAVVVASVVCLF